MTWRSSMPVETASPPEPAAPLLPACPVIQSLPPAPPFDLLLRILSSPPSSDSAQRDPLLSAVADFACHHSSIAVLCAYLSSPRVVLLSPARPVHTRCVLLLLPTYAQRGLLSLLLCTLPALQPPQSRSIWSLLDGYGAELAEERRRGMGGGERATAALFSAAECDCLLLLLRSIYHRASRPLPAAILQPPPLGPCLAPFCHHTNNLALTQLTPIEQPSPAVSPASPSTYELQSTPADTASSTAVSDSAPPLTPLVALLQSFCAGEGSQWSAIVQQAAEAGNDEGDASSGVLWGVQQSVESVVSTAGELCAFDDDCFATATEARKDSSAVTEPGETHSTAEEGKEVQENQPAREAMQSETQSLDDSLQPPSTVDDSATCVAAVPALLSALNKLRLHDLVGVFPSGSRTAISDEQLRHHASLSHLIPLVDAVHALPSSDALEFSFTRPSADSLTPATLPVELHYVFVRLLLTAAVSQQRAVVIVRQSMRHLVNAAVLTYTRYTEEALAHAVAAHPQAVYQTLLTPLVTPTAVASLQPQHVKFVAVCVSNNTARIDLSQQFCITLAHSLQVNAAHSPTALAPAVVPSVAAIGVLVDCLQPTTYCPLSPPLITALVSLLCALAALPTFAGQDKQWMTRVSSLLKLLMTDEAGVAACRERKAELLLGWGKLKSLRAKYLLAAMQAEKLERL